MNISEALKKRGQKVVRELFDSLKAGKKTDLENIESYIEKLIDEIIHQGESKLQRISVPDIASYLSIHSVNTAILSTIMAYKMGIEGLELKEICIGALLHDIGKINTPEKLLYKQDGDSEYERKTISEHPTFGAHWMSTSALLSDEIVMIIRNHHERYDGDGYPEGVSTRDMPRSVHIVSICNYYDNLITGFPEKLQEETMDTREACFQLTRESSKRFNIKFVNLFISLMGPMLMDGPLYRKTALVLLDSREVAAVVKTVDFGDTLPEILILTNSQGKKLTRPLPVNLKKDDSRKIVKLLRT